MKAALTSDSAHDSITCKIQDYGVIGDCRAAALVSRQGSLDWLCWPRFDSPAIFCALLDAEVGGFWRIAPREPYESTRHYVSDTNILQTRFRCANGAAVLTDLMPVAAEGHKREALVPDHEILRQVECIAGEFELHTVFHPRADYGRAAVRIRSTGKLGLRMEVGKGVYWLRSSLPLVLREDTAELRTRMKGGQIIQFSLTYAEESPVVMRPLGESVSECIERTTTWWQNWAQRASYNGPYREAVVRSALALKLLTYAPSGAMVAAITTSLPERIGGDLNWDYRYCWLRDASLTARALLGLGYRDEADAFVGWLLETTALTRPKLHASYTLYGERPPRERELSHLCGYRGSRPVRIGNAARGQLQLDVYGEVVDAALQFLEHGGDFDNDTQKILNGIGEYVARNWRQPDEGIWEARTGRQDHTYSRLLCWTALDGLLRLHEHGAVRDVPVENLCSQREQIRAEIQARAWNQHLQSYVTVLDGDDVDASLLLIPWYDFESAGSPRMQATYRRISDRLRAGKNLLYRYRTGIPEGAFGICSFWEVEYLALGGGPLERAHELFRELLTYGNDLNLFAEEIDPESGDALGNFPQAFTHVGLISAALALQERETEPLAAGGTA